MYFAIEMLCFVIGGFTAIVCLMWLAAYVSKGGRRQLVGVSISGLVSVALLILGGWLLLRSAAIP